MSNERICLACTHIRIEFGGGPGADTGGDPGCGECLKKHWSIGADTDDGDLFMVNLKARTCPDYELSDLAKKHGWTL